MPLYVGDYLRDTGDLTTVEHGAYLLLIMQAWTRGGALPTDSERLRSLTRMTEADWGRSGEIIMGFFFREGDVYRHKRVDKELVNATASIEQRRAAGKASASRRKSNDIPTEVQRDANETANETPTEIERPLSSRCHSVEVSLATEVQRDAIPSPSPSPSERKKESGSLRSPVVPRSESDDEDFAQFWALYPRKDAKIDARKAWAHAIRLSSAADIIAGLERYPFNADPTLQKLPGGWLRDGRWLIEADTPPPTVIASAGESEMARFDRMLGESDVIDQEGRLI